MAFSNQFSLSVELTRLLPLGPAVNLFGGAVTKLARELTSYGSDIVVEEDLAAIFGRLKICQHFERTFCMAVGTTERTAISSVLDIVLESGPGPTVRRALTARPEDYRYLSTVIQLSLLSHVHELGSLAGGLSDILRRRLDGAPPDHTPAPGYDALYGVLRACQEQTNQFQWHLLLNRVYQDLGGAYEEAYKTAYPSESRPRNPLALEASTLALLPPILQGLLDMLLAVQSLPEDRSIHIQTLKGIPTIITWAHHVLGLTVQVNLVNEEGISDPRVFGQGQPQVVIDAHKGEETSEDSIVLLNPGDSGILFHLSDEDVIRQPLEPSKRRPLAGFARDFIDSTIKSRGAKIHGVDKNQFHYEVAVNTLHNGIIGYMNTASPLSKSPVIPGPSLNEFHSKLHDTPYGSWDQVESAMQILFGQNFPELDRTVLSRINNSPSHPKSRAKFQLNINKIKIDIKSLVSLTRMLSCLDNVGDCLDLQIPINFGEEATLDYSKLTASPNRGLWGRRGSYDYASSNGYWCESSLMESFAPMLLGSNFHHQEGNGSKAFKRAGLISGLGWSVYLPTVDMIDPYYVTPFRIFLRRGVPIRNGDLRRRIEDPASQPVVTLPKKGSDCRLLLRAEDCEDEVADLGEEGAREDLSDIDLSDFLVERDESRASFVRPQIGVTSSAFLVSFVVESPSWGKASIGMRAAYRIAATPNLRKLKACGHEEGNIRQPLSETKLGSDVYLSTGPDPILPTTNPNLSRFKVLRESGYFILPTGGSIAGRWLSLCLWHDQDKVVALRHPTTCLQCMLYLAKEKVSPPGRYSAAGGQRVFLF